MISKSLKYIFLLAIILTLACGHGRYRSPRVISSMDIDYPLSAQLNRIEGEVLVAVFVDKDGAPEEVKLLESSGHEDLDKAALKFAKSVKFEPAELDGKPISSWTRLLLKYKLTEVYFDKDQWLSEVLRLQNKIAMEKDSTQREIYLKRLYTKLVGLTNYVERKKDIRINSIIKDAVSKPIKKRYANFWSEFPAPFAVFDDFLLRYPDASFINLAKEDLIRLLIDTEYAVRMKSIKSKRISKKYLDLLDTIEKRLDELQQPPSAALMRLK